MFHIPEHFSPSVASDIHPHNNAPHTDQGGSPHTSSPASVTSGTDFPSAGASGKPTGLLGNLSAFPSEYTSVKLPGDATSYYIKNSSGTGSSTLYTRDPQTSMYTQTSKQVAPDGHGGWQRDDGLKGGGDTEQPGGSSSRDRGRIVAHAPSDRVVPGRDGQGNLQWQAVDDRASRGTMGIQPGKGWVTAGRQGLESYIPKSGERPTKEVLVDIKDAHGRTTNIAWKYYHGSTGK
jgi:hypothetical protein